MSAGFGVGPPTCWFVVHLDELPDVGVTASTAEGVQRIREHVVLPDTRCAITDAMFDAFEEPEQLDV